MNKKKTTAGEVRLLGPEDVSPEKRLEIERHFAELNAELAQAERDAAIAACGNLDDVKAERDSLIASAIAAAVNERPALLDKIEGQRTLIESLSEIRVEANVIATRLMVGLEMVKAERDALLVELAAVKAERDEWKRCADDLSVSVAHAAKQRDEALAENSRLTAELVAARADRGAQR